MDATIPRASGLSKLGPAATQPLAPPKRATLQNSKLPFPVVLYLLTIIMPIGFNAGPLAMTTLRLLLIVMVVPLLAGLLSGRYGRIFVTDILFVLHLLWIWQHWLSITPAKSSSR